MLNDEIKIFAGSSARSFVDKICSYLSISSGSSEVIHFSEGNTFVRINENIRNKDVYIVQPIGLSPNDEFTEILFWMDACKRASAKSVTAVIPYFSYGKGDKKDEPRVSIRGRVCAECIEIAGADRVITMDLHSPQIQGFFKKPVDHLYALPILCEYIKEIKPDNLVVVSPDAGFSKQAKAYAEYLGASLAICDKTRTDHSESAKILGLIGEVKGKNALIVDDMSISGGTLLEVANILQQLGAKRIMVCLTHVLLNKKGVQAIEESAIEVFIGTDTVDNRNVLNSEKFHIISVAPLFAEAISRIHNHQSISVLFNQIPKSVIQKFPLSK